MYARQLILAIGPSRIALVLKKSKITWYEKSPLDYIYPVTQSSEETMQVNVVPVGFFIKASHAD